MKMNKPPFKFSEIPREKFEAIAVCNPVNPQLKLAPTKLPSPKCNNKINRQCHWKYSPIQMRSLMNETYVIPNFETDGIESDHIS